MKLVSFAATVCIALFLGTAAVAGKNCDAEKQLEVLALNIYHEARGEGRKGMVMAGEATLNRVASNEFPDNVCDVVYQKYQFSWVRDKKINKEPTEEDMWEISLEIAEDLLTDNQVSYDHLATHFVNLKVANPPWTKNLIKVEKVGKHTFFRM
jgi:N-acetylmuramoyl-L-alanine amidase